MAAYLVLCRLGLGDCYLFERVIDMPWLARNLSNCNCGGHRDRICSIVHRWGLGELSEANILWDIKLIEAVIGRL